MSLVEVGGVKLLNVSSYGKVLGGLLVGRVMVASTLRIRSFFHISSETDGVELGNRLATSSEPSTEKVVTSKCQFVSFRPSIPVIPVTIHYLK